MGVKAQVWRLKQKPEKTPTLADFECVTEQLPQCQDGDFIIEAEWVTVDPYVRIMIQGAKAGDVIEGGQVAKVIDSKNPEYPVGCRLVHYPGWRSHSLVTAASLKEDAFLPTHKLYPEMGQYRRSTALGVLGMTGNTAYWGFLELCQPKPGDVVAVSAAAGAVGSLVCQIAKIKGCKVIGFAGSKAKCDWLRELGVDCAVNYKNDDIEQALSNEAPDGVNCYFDNVGGQFTAKVLPHMALFGRVAVCGAISTYNDPNKGFGVINMNSPYSEGVMLSKQLRVEAFMGARWFSQWNQSVDQMRQWLDAGELQYKESVTEGFLNIPKTFIGLFEGENMGKAVVKVQ